MRRADTGLSLERCLAYRFRRQDRRRHGFQRRAARNRSLRQKGGGCGAGAHNPRVGTLRPRGTKRDRGRLSNYLAIRTDDQGNWSGILRSTIERHLQGCPLGDGSIATAQGMYARRICNRYAHTRVPGGRHQAQQRRALGVNAEDRLRRRGGNRRGQRCTLGNLPVHEGRLSPGTDPSPVGLHVNGQGVLIGEPACQQDRYRRVGGNRHLTWSRIERPERPVAIDTDDRSRRAGIGQDEDHVSTRRGRTHRDPLGGAGGRAADGTESCEFTATLADKRQARRDDAAGTRD